MVLERHQPGREASWAAGGMLADREAGSHPLFRSMARVSAAMYPQWVHQLQDESGVQVDLREQGTIRFLDDDDWLEPHANAEQLALARETDADIVVAGYQDYYEDGDRHDHLGGWVLTRLRESRCGAERDGR